MRILGRPHHPWELAQWAFPIATVIRLTRRGHALQGAEREKKLREHSHSSRSVRGQQMLV